MKRIYISLMLLLSLFFLSCNNNLTKVTIWYQSMSSESKCQVPPPDWVGYKQIEDDLGIELKLRALPSLNDEADRVILDAAHTGNLPDLFFVGTQALKDLVLLGSVIPLDNYLQNIPVRAETLHYQDYASFSTFNGKLYGFTTIGGLPKNEGLVIRKDWLDKLGLSVPKTLDEFITVMYAFTYDDPDGNGIQDTYGFGAYIDCSTPEGWLGKGFSPIFGALGCEGTFDIERKQLTVHNPNFYYALNTISYFNTNRLIDPNWVIYTKSSFRDAWKFGRFGCMRENFAALYKKDNYYSFDKNFPNGEWIVIDPIVGYELEDEACIGIDYTPTRTISISKNCYNSGKVEKVCELLEWMSTKGYNTICYGQEGINYVIKDGKVSYENVPHPFIDVESIPYRPLTTLVTSYSIEEQLLNYVPFYSINGKYIEPLEKLKEMQSKKWGKSINNMPASSIEFKDSCQRSLLELVVGTKELNRETWTDWLKKFDEAGGIEWEIALCKSLDYYNAQ